jgi:hypothetical protein
VYRTAAVHINRGLSLVPRLILGFFALLFGVVMFLVAPPGPKAVYFYVFAGFCVLISIACIVRGRARQFVGSVIGTLLFLFTATYVVYEVWSGTLLFSGRAEPSIWNSGLCLLFFGLPGAAYALRVRFGFTKSPSVGDSGAEAPPNNRWSGP